MKCFKFIQTICILAATLAVGACSQEELETVTTAENTTTTANGETQSIKIEIVDSGIQPTSATRATTSDTYLTSFEDGDQIGIYVVSDENALLVENVVATYDATEDSWSAEISISTDEVSTATFYAYYPYQATTSFDATATDPFSAMVSGWAVQTDQSTENSYDASDLMTASASINTDNSTVTFSMVHQMALVVAKLPYYSYTDGYTVNELFGVGFTANETTAYTPLYDESTTYYRLLVNKSSLTSLTGTFINPSTTISSSDVKTYTVSVSDLTASSYSLCTVDKGAAISIDHSVTVGDFIYSNGAIYSSYQEYDGATCVGVVYYAGNPQPSTLYSDTYTTSVDALYRDYSDCTHGLALGLTEYTGAFTSTAKTAAIATWLKASAYADMYIDLGQFTYASNYTTESNWKTEILGYNNTEILKLYAESGVTEIYHVVESLSTLTHATPSNSTGWYIPSACEMYSYILGTNQETINNSLEVITDATTLKYGETAYRYWTSTDRANTVANMTTVYAKTESGSAEAGNASTSTASGSSFTMYARYAFAF